MTESVEDIYGWGSPEAIKHHARRWAWCVKHRHPYRTWLFTSGFVYGCERCDDEKHWRDSITETDTPLIPPSDTTR